MAKYYVLSFFNLLFILQLNAQHDLQAQFIRNNTETAVYLNPTSHMFNGEIIETRIRMDELESGQEGEISATLTGYDGVAIARICLLRNDNKRYCIRIAPEGGYVEATESGTSPQKVNDTDFNFQVNDTFRVARCLSKILYYQNNRLIHVTQLADSNEVFFGVVQAESADDLNFRIEFTPQ